MLFEKSQETLNNLFAGKAEQQVVNIVTAQTAIIKGTVSVSEHAVALDGG
jgi:hypothetical protein